MSTRSSYKRHRSHSNHSNPHPHPHIGECYQPAFREHSGFDDIHEPPRKFLKPHNQFQYGSSGIHLHQEAQYQNNFSYLNSERSISNSYFNCKLLKQRRMELKKTKPPVAKIPNNLLEIKTVDDFPHANIKTTEIVKEKKRGNTISEQEARRLAILLEKEIKEEIQQMNVNKCGTPGKNLKPQAEEDLKNTKSKIEDHSSQVQELLNRPSEVQKDNQKKTLVGSSVLKIELEEIMNSLYEVVTVRTETGDIVTWKSPVLVRPSIKDAESFISNPVSNKRDTHFLRKKLFDNFNVRMPMTSGLVPPSTIRKESPSLTEQLNVKAPMQDVPVSRVVVIENLSRSTKTKEVKKLALKIGDLSSIVHDQHLGRAELKFQTPEKAHQFYLKFHRKMIDLSKVRVSLV